MEKPKIHLGTDGSISFLSRQGDSLIGVRITPDGESTALAGEDFDGTVFLTESSSDGSAGLMTGMDVGSGIVGAKSGPEGAEPWALIKPEED